LEVLHNYVFVVEIGTSTFKFVLTAGCEHPTSWRVMWTSYYFAKEAKLSGSNHVYDTWYVIEHLAILLIAGVIGRESKAAG
jgi:hypothetical protein